MQADCARFLKQSNNVKKYPLIRPLNGTKMDNIHDHFTMRVELGIFRNLYRSLMYNIPFLLYMLYDAVYGGIYRDFTSCSCNGVM